MSCGDLLTQFFRPFREYLLGLNFLYFLFASLSLCLCPLVYFQIIFVGFLSSIFMYSILKSSLRGSSLQLLINYRELKQLELQRYTINEHTLHDATHSLCNHWIAMQIPLSFNLSLCLSPYLLIVLTSTSPTHTPQIHTHTHIHSRVGAGFPVH